MNDRFKFRAWWKPNYRKPIMLYDVEKTYDFMRGEPESICADCFGEVLEDKDYIVMQCTGLKDENGKLIYEGDVVKDISLNMIFKVGYKKCTFYLENKEHIGYFHELATAYSKKRLEVIGNIYENKDLLNKNG